MTPMHDQNMFNFFFFMFGMCDLSIALNMIFLDIYLFIYFIKIFLIMIDDYRDIFSMCLHHLNLLFSFPF